MKSIPKLIRHLVGTLLLSFLFLPVLNILVLTSLLSAQESNIIPPWTTAREAAEDLQMTENGYMISESMSARLSTYDIWAFFIDNDLHVVWQTDNLPDTIPLTYTPSGIANLTLGYIDGYPAFTGESENGLMVLGYPKESFWKEMHPGWDYQLIKNAPKTLLFMLFFNVTAIFLIYITANSALLKSIKPIVNAIQALPTGEEVYVPEKGLLSEIAANINRTYEVLQSQKYQLRKKETARANWIAGVSHDIRTPLSMVMGYAAQLQEDVTLPKTAHDNAVSIVRQSEKIRDLINDLNLASKLEYNMQPIHLAKENIIAITRQVVVDFMNTDMTGKYPIVWETDESLPPCFICADKKLIRRAVNNLIQNSINHNMQGCTIYIKVTADKETAACNITVADDGMGISDEQIEKISHTPHYMVCDENTDRQRHGLGLLIVKQIMTAHGGKTIIGKSTHGGFLVTLTFPPDSSEAT